jgi:hypothetical protein
MSPSDNTVPGYSMTTLKAAQANTLAAVQVQVQHLNDARKANYLTTFSNWSQSELAGRSDNSNPPKAPMAYAVGYCNDPTTRGGVSHRVRTHTTLSSGPIPP